MFIFNGLKAAVTISGSVATGYTAPAANQTQKQVHYTSNLTSSYADVLTVTGGKTLYITSVDYYATGALGGASFPIFLSDNGTQIFCFGIGTVQNHTHVSFPVPLAFTTKAQVKADNTHSGYLTLIGFEQ